MTDDELHLCISQCRLHLGAHGWDLEVVLNGPCDSASLDDAQNVLRSRFSASHKAFLLRHDGIRLVARRRDRAIGYIDQIKVFSVSDLIEATRLTWLALTERGVSDRDIFLPVGRYTDAYVALSPGSGDRSGNMPAVFMIRDDDLFELPGSAVRIAGSFDDWLSLSLASMGSGNWGFNYTDNTEIW
jgi:hypothetical protein